MITKIGSWYQIHKGEIAVGAFLTVVNAAVWIAVSPHLGMSVKDIVGMALATNVVLLSLSRWHFHNIDKGNTVKKWEVLLQNIGIALVTLGIFCFLHDYNVIANDYGIDAGYAILAVATLNCLRAAHLKSLAYQPTAEESSDRQK